MQHKKIQSAAIQLVFIII